MKRTSKGYTPEQLVLDGLFIQRRYQQEVEVVPPGEQELRHSVLEDDASFIVHDDNFRCFLERLGKLVRLKDRYWQLAIGAWTAKEIQTPGDIDFAASVRRFREMRMPPKVQRSSKAYLAAASRFESDYSHALMALTGENAFGPCFNPRFFPRTSQARDLFFEFVQLWLSYKDAAPGRGSGRRRQTAALSPEEQALTERMTHAAKGTEAGSARMIGSTIAERRGYSWRRERDELPALTQAVKRHRRRRSL